MYHFDNNYSMNNVKYNKFYRNAEYSGFVNGYNLAIYQKCFDLGYEYGRKNKEVFQIPDFYKKLHEPIIPQKKPTKPKKPTLITTDELSYSDFSEISDQEHEDFSPPKLPPRPKSYNNNKMYSYYEPLDSPNKSSMKHNMFNRHYTPLPKVVKSAVL